MAATIATYTKYNENHYSRPWAAIVRNGRMDFLRDACTGSAAEGGALIIEQPRQGVTYAVGQKDYNYGKYTSNQRVIWDGTRFVAVDRAGEPVEILGVGPNMDLFEEVQAEAGADEKIEEQEVAGMTDAEIADAICAEVYAAHTTLTDDMAERIRKALRTGILSSRYDNGGEPSKTFYIECLSLKMRLLGCINVWDGEHMEWAACYMPTLTLDRYENNPKYTEEYIETKVMPRLERKRPLATYKYTRLSDERGVIERVDITEPEQKRIEAQGRQS